jgi:1,4-dihydroxy-2-naphthoyl-CoA hydrolase
MFKLSRRYFVHLRADVDLAFLNQIGRGHFPEHVGITITSVSQGSLEGVLPVTPQLMAPNGYLHAGSVVTLADTLAGYACAAHLPENATGFTTVELKTNFLGTTRQGTLQCEARAAHLGRTTQIWDATVWSSEARDKPIALFRCTQLVLYPKP